MPHCVVPENIHATPSEGICRITPFPSGFSKIGPQNLSPPLEFPKFLHTLWKYCYLLLKWTEVVLFTRTPNFVIFMYFLLNCITDKRIPYVNSLCAQVTNKFCESHVFSVEFCKRKDPVIIISEFLLPSSHEQFRVLCSRHARNMKVSFCRLINYKRIKDKTLFLGNLLKKKLKYWTKRMLIYCR